MLQQAIETDWALCKLGARSSAELAVPSSVAGRHQRASVDGSGSSVISEVYFDAKEAKSLIIK